MKSSNPRLDLEQEEWRTKVRESNEILRKERENAEYWLKVKETKDMDAAEAAVESQLLEPKQLARIESWNRLGNEDKEFHAWAKDMAFEIQVNVCSFMTLGTSTSKCCAVQSGSRYAAHKQDLHRAQGECPFGICCSGTERNGPNRRTDGFAADAIGVGDKRVRLSM